VTSGKAVQIQNASALQLGNVAASSTLSVTTGGAISQAAGTAVTAAGTTLTAGTTHDITLANAGNDFDQGGGTATLTVTSGRNVQLRDANALQLGNLAVSGALSVTAAGAVAQASGTHLSVSGTTGLTGASLALTQTSNSFGSAVSLTSAGDASLTAGRLALGNVSVPGALTLSYTGTLALPASLTVGSLNTLGGAVSLAGAVATTGGAMQLGAVTLTADSVLATAGGHVTTGTINGAKMLTINPGAGTVAINGTIGGVAKPTALVLNGSGAATIASVTALGLLDLSGKTAGSVTFPGSVNIDSLTTSANPYSIAFNGGGTIGDPIFSNTGTLTSIS